MIDNYIQIWNLLHDGEITAISGEDSNTLTMFVNIPYIRRKFTPLGDSLVLKFSGLSLIEFRDFDNKISTLREELEIGRPEILSTDSASMPIIIETTMGKLTLNYESLHIFLDTGQPIEFELINKICDEYWIEWENRK